VALETPAHKNRPDIAVEVDRLIVGPRSRRGQPDDHSETDHARVELSKKRACH
jgi:hypothetical protein